MPITLYSIPAFLHPQQLSRRKLLPALYPPLIGIILSQDVPIPRAYPENVLPIAVSIQSTSLKLAGQNNRWKRGVRVLGLCAGWWRSGLWAEKYTIVQAEQEPVYLPQIISCLAEIQPAHANSYCYDGGIWEECTGMMKKYKEVKEGTSRVYIDSPMSFSSPSTLPYPPFRSGSRSILRLSLSSFPAIYPASYSSTQTCPWVERSPVTFNNSLLTFPPLPIFAKSPATYNQGETQLTESGEMPFAGNDDRRRVGVFSQFHKHYLATPLLQLLLK